MPPLPVTRSGNVVWKSCCLIVPTAILLDVGTGIGQFLHHARPHFTDVQGTEVSASAVRVAQEKYGLKVHQGRVEEMGFPPESFNNITLFHVLEHVPDPADMVACCRNLLRADGVLAIAVPNDVLAWTSKLKKLGRNLGLGPFQEIQPGAGNFARRQLTGDTSIALHSGRAQQAAGRCRLHHSGTGN